MMPFLWEDLETLMRVILDFTLQVRVHSLTKLLILLKLQMSGVPMHSMMPIECMYLHMK